MELRVNLSCQIVCVYLTCFLNLGLRDNLCPLSDSGLSVPSIYGVASEFEVSISLCLYNMFWICEFRDHLCSLSDLGLLVPMSVDLFVKSCVGFTIYFYCCLSVSNLNSLNNIDGWPILFVFLFLLVSSCLFADMFQSEMWSEFLSSTPEHLQPTASLVKSIVLGSKADGTVRTCLGGFRRWKRWASSNHVCLFPANPFQVAIYLQCLLQDANSPSPVLNAVYSIDWAQQMAGLSKISDHPLVSLMVSASRRLLGRPKFKRDPGTPEMLKALVESKITDKSPSISDLRSVALCLIRYAGFFCFSKLSHIKA